MILKRQDYMDVGESIIEIAHSIFCDCGAEDDFCVQYAGGSIIFGGTNRLILGRRGWSVDRVACTDRFLELWDCLYENT